MGTDSQAEHEHEHAFESWKVDHRYGLGMQSPKRLCTLRDAAA